MLTANVHEAKTQLSRLIDAALRGEDVVIARNGAPAVKLVPVVAAPLDREGGFWRGKVKISDVSFDAIDPEIERLFYESVIVPEGDRALAPDEAGLPKPGQDDASSR